jgi:hypothetical protein
MESSKRTLESFERLWPALSPKRVITPNARSSPLVHERVSGRSPPPKTPNLRHTFPGPLAIVGTA